jgi:hypothetical protein
VSKATFHFLDAYVWRRVTAWLRKRHLGIGWKELYRRFLTGRPGNRPAENGIVMFDTMQVEVTRYRWACEQHPDTMDEHRGSHDRHLTQEPVERRMRGNALVRCGGRAGGTDQKKLWNRAPARPLHHRIEPVGDGTGCFTEPGCTEPVPVIASRLL